MLRKFRAISLVMGAFLPLVAIANQTAWQLPSYSVIDEMEYHPGGAVMITVRCERPGLRGDVRLYDSATHQLIRIFGRYSAISADFVGNGNFLAISTKTAIHIYDWRNGRYIRQLSTDTAAAGAIKVSHNGQYVVAGTRNTPFRVYNVDTGALIATLAGNALVYPMAQELAFSGDDTKVAVKGGLFSVVGGALIRKISAGPRAISADSKYLATLTSKSKVRLSDLNTGATLWDKEFNASETHSGDDPTGGGFYTVTTTETFDFRSIKFGPNAAIYLSGWWDSNRNDTRFDPYDSQHGIVTALKTPLGGNPTNLFLSPQYVNRNYHTAPVTEFDYAPGAAYPTIAYTEFTYEGAGEPNNLSRVPIQVGPSSPTPWHPVSLYGSEGIFPGLAGSVAQATGNFGVWSPIKVNDGPESRFSAFNRATGQPLAYNGSAGIGAVAGPYLGAAASSDNSWAFTMSESGFLSGSRLDASIGSTTVTSRKPLSEPVLFGSQFVSFASQGASVSDHVVETWKFTPGTGALARVNTLTGNYLPVGPVSDGSGTFMLISAALYVNRYNTATNQWALDSTNYGTFGNYRAFTIGQFSATNFGTLCQDSDGAITFTKWHFGSPWNDGVRVLVPAASAGGRVAKLSLSRDGTLAAIALNGDGALLKDEYFLMRTSDGKYLDSVAEGLGVGIRRLAFSTNTQQVLLERNDGSLICFAVPPQVYSANFPKTLASGQAGTVRVTVTGAGEPQGTKVSFVAAPTGLISIADSVTLAAGASTVDVPFTAGTVTSPTVVAVTVKINGVGKTYNITINP